MKYLKSRLAILFVFAPGVLALGVFLFLGASWVFTGEVSPLKERMIVAGLLLIVLQFPWLIFWALDA